MTRFITRRGVMGGAAAYAAVLPSGSVSSETPSPHEVEIRSFKFHPEVVEVQIGDIIRWTNMDLAPHTATADGLGWDTETLEQYQSAEVEVTAGMETSYFCAFHPHMKGKIAIAG